MKISIRVVVFAALFLTAAICTIVAFVPTYQVGVEGVRESVANLRENTIARANISVANFIGSPERLLKKLTRLGKTGIQLDINATTNLEIVCSLLEQMPGIALETNYITYPHTTPASGPRIYNCQRVPMLPDGMVMSTVLTSPNTPPLYFGGGDVAPYNLAMNMRLPAIQNMTVPMYGLVVVMSRWAGRIWSTPTIGRDRLTLVGFADFPNCCGTAARLAITIGPEKFQDLLTSLGLRKNGRAIIMHGEDRIALGTSWDEAPFVPLPNVSDGTLPDEQRMIKKRLTDFNDETIKTAVQEIGGDDAFYALPDGYSETFLKGKDTLYVDVAVFRDNSTGLDLRVLIVMPEKDFLEKIESQQGLTIAGVCIAAFVMVTLGLVFAYFLGVPLKTLGDRMALTASLQDDDEEIEESMLSEIADMQSAYTMMKAELTRMKSYLPQSVLTVDNDDEEDEGEVSVSGSASASRSRENSKAETRSAASRSSRHSSTSRGAVPIAALNISKSVVNKRVTVAVFNLVRFHGVQAQDGGSSARVIAVQTSLLEVVSAHATANRGVVDSFNGDRVVVSFNAVTNCASPGKRAAICASAAVKELSQKANVPPVTVGIASSATACGNMGTTTIKRFNIIGTCYPNAFIMERFARGAFEKQQNEEAAKTRPWCIAMTNDLFNEVGLEFYYESIDIVRGATAPKVGALLMHAKSASMDEWMYQLEETGNKDPFTDQNAAFAALLAGNNDAARESFDKVGKADVKARLETLASEGLGAATNVSFSQC